MISHTPGPWSCGEENVGGGFNIYSGALRIAHTSIQARVFKPETRPIAEDEAKANAYMVAAAPDLLASLKEMLEIYWGEGDGELPEPVCIQNARAAISKAVQP